MLRNSETFHRNVIFQIRISVNGKPGVRQHLKACFPAKQNPSRTTARDGFLKSE
jgi:hypothetical protein